MSSPSLTQKLASPSTLQTASFAHDRCLRKRLNRCDCVNCLDVCASGAISLKDRSISFDSSVCTGCMLCATACPNDAFTFSEFAVDSLCFSEEKAEPVVISCHQQSQIYPEERLVPCLGGITNEHLLALNMYGETAIAFNVSSCAECQNNHGVIDLLHRLAWLKQKNRSLFSRQYIIIPDQNEVIARDQSARRSFLNGLKESVYETIDSLFSFPIDSSRPAPAVRTSRRIPARVQIKKHLMGKVASRDRQALSRLINHRLIISGACNLCPLCKGICPTGAIQVEQSEGKKELTFDGTLCSGCGLCVSFCKHNALSLVRPDSWTAAANSGSQPSPPEALLPLVEKPVRESESENV